MTIALGILILLYLAVCEILDWHGRMEVIHERWPWVWRLVNDRPARLVLLIVTAGLLVADFRRDVPKEAQPPSVVFPSVDPGAKNAEIARLNDENQRLRATRNQTALQHNRQTSAGLPVAQAITPQNVAPLSQNGVSPARVVELVETLHRVFVQRKAVTFVFTAPKGSEEFRENFYAILRAACQQEPHGDCTREPTPDPDVDLDFKIPLPTYQGIVIHTTTEPSAEKLGAELVQFLTPCMVIRKSSQIPEPIKRINPSREALLLWFEMGSGSPWKQPCAR